MMTDLQFFVLIAECVGMLFIPKKWVGVWLSVIIATTVWVMFS
jgi:hypothetical protein